MGTPIPMEAAVYLMVPVGRGRGLDEVGHGVWNVDGQRRDVSLHRLHRDLGRLLLLLSSRWNRAVNASLMFVL